MCGTKNFSSVRSYLAPQLLHRTIVAILGICAYGRLVQAVSCLPKDSGLTLGRSSTVSPAAAGGSLCTAAQDGSFVVTKNPVRDWRSGTEKGEGGSHQIGVTNLSRSSATTPGILPIHMGNGSRLGILEEQDLGFA